MAAERAEAVGIGEAEIAAGSALYSVSASITEVLSAGDKAGPDGRHADLFGLGTGDAFAFVATSSDARQTEGYVVLHADVLCRVTRKASGTGSTNTTSPREIDADTFEVFVVEA